MGHQEIFLKKGTYFFWFVVRDFNISDMFYKIRTLSKEKFKQYSNLLSKKLKLHCPYELMNKMVLSISLGLIVGKLFVCLFSQIQACWGLVRGSKTVFKLRKIFLSLRQFFIGKRETAKIYTFYLILTEFINKKIVFCTFLCAKIFQQNFSPSQNKFIAWLGNLSTSGLALIEKFK